MTGRLNLKVPCKNCPFANRDTRIRFRCRERAEEIEEHAYRRGFPCHLSATLEEDENGESSGYEFGPNTQHCAGAIGMFLNEGYTAWPGTGNRDMDNGTYAPAQAVAFWSVEAFFDANEELSNDPA